jgi:UDP-N-acetylmuramoylalanine--D-glutamate ligase
LDHRFDFSYFWHRLFEISITDFKFMVAKTLVLGLGVSGIAAARFLLKQGYAILGVDDNYSYLETNETIRDLQTVGMICQRDNVPIDWASIDRVVVSPGIHPKHPIYQAAKIKGVEIVSETELALSYFKKPMVAVTGTNGKTTVTLLAEHILNSVGIKTKALGNVGMALCDYLINPGSEAAFVVELSSFQLEAMRTPVFNAAVLLNITADHLERYTSMQDYARAKCQLQYLLKDNGLFFVQMQTVREFAHLLPLKNYQTFGLENGCDLWTDQGLIKYREKIECIMPIRYREMGRHDNENLLAAWSLCRPFSISNEQFCRALETFQKPPHRIEFVREINGVSFFDDSKGTNIDAVIQAAKVMKGPVILIVGGVDKGASYLPWKEQLCGKVKQMIAIGTAAPKIYSELQSYFNIKLAGSLAAAVKVAASDARKGDCVLLSPGCSSYDMFRNYSHRGEEFQRYVHSIE